MRRWSSLPTSVIAIRADGSGPHAATVAAGCAGVWTVADSADYPAPEASPGSRRAPWLSTRGTPRPHGAEQENLESARPGTRPGTTQGQLRRLPGPTTGPLQVREQLGQMSSRTSASSSRSRVTTGRRRPGSPGPQRDHESAPAVGARDPDASHATATTGPGTRANAAPDVTNSGEWRSRASRTKTQVSERVAGRSSRSEAQAGDYSQ